MTGELRHERHQIDVRASAGEVWRGLTTGKGLEAWIVTEGRVDPGAGGTVVRSWGEGQEGRARIDVWEEARRLVLVAVDESGADTTPPHLEEWTLEHEDGVTRVRLVHSLWDEGSEDWAADYDDFRRGWALFLECLRHWLEREDGQPRASTMRMTSIAEPPDAAWAAILEALGAPGELGPGATVTVAGETGRVRCSFPGRSLLVALDGGGTLLADVEGPPGGRWVYALASTFGPDDAPTAARRQRLVTAVEPPSSG